MIALLCFVLAVLAAPFKSKSRLEAENAALRRQLIVLRRKVQGRVRLTNNDRWFLIQLYRWFPSILHVLTIIRPETLVRWHRAGFCCYWRWKSRPRGGRPQIETDLRALSFGGFVGMGKDFYPMPWSTLKYDTNLGGYRANLTKDQLDKAPKYSKSTDWNWNRDNDRRVHDYYKATPYWPIP